MKIGWIDYLNTLPFNFELTGQKPDFEYALIKGVPSEINNLLSQGKIDIGFISSAHYIENAENFLIFPELSISSLNKVLSVIILSDISINKIKKIYLTSASKTSRYLTRIIFEIFLNKQISYFEMTETNIKKMETVLLIGDTAIENLNKKKYQYDLSKIWYEKTKKPFVFALWCVRKEFYYENKDLVINLHKILKKSKNKFFEKLEIFIKPSTFEEEYLKNLDYCLSKEHIDSLKLFANYLKKLSIISKIPEFNFI